MARTVGVLALQGDVAEHLSALEAAARRLKHPVASRPIRTKGDLAGLDGLIIPGGESTTLQKLCEREGMFSAIQSVPNIFGTCAGAIMLAKEIEDAAPDQRTLDLMDITVKRNAYGRQQDSFEEDIKTELGPVHAVFIRAPRILRVGKGVKVLAKGRGGIVACEEVSGSRYCLATAFHPELTTGVFHEYFITRMR